MFCADQGVSDTHNGRSNVGRQLAILQSVAISVQRQDCERDVVSGAKHFLQLTLLADFNPLTPCPFNVHQPARVDRVAKGRQNDHGTPDQAEKREEERRRHEASDPECNETA
jgi:hypothetical protein